MPERWEDAFGGEAVRPLAVVSSRLTPSAFRFGTRRDEWDWARTKPAREECVGGGAPEPSKLTYFACPTPVIQPHRDFFRLGLRVVKPTIDESFVSVAILAFFSTDGL